jgi:hypothetical protein
MQAGSCNNHLVVIKQISTKKALTVKKATTPARTSAVKYVLRFSMSKYLPNCIHASKCTIVGAVRTDSDQAEVTKYT